MVPELNLRSDRLVAEPHLRRDKKFEVLSSNYPKNVSHRTGSLVENLARQDAQNATSGSLISLHPLRAFDITQACFGRDIPEFWLRLCCARFSAVKFPESEFFGYGCDTSVNTEVLSQGRSQTPELTLAARMLVSRRIEISQDELIS